VKQAITAILAILYMTVASGVEMNFHYCMGEVASVDYGKAKDEDCSKCGMKSKAGCCEDQSRIIKIEDNHQASVVGWIFQTPAALPAPYPFTGNTPVASLAFTARPSVNDPPALSAPPVYIRNCVFRI
jgi:hypothetical protein